MRAVINRCGKLTLLPESQTEEYASLRWFDEACKGTVELCVEMQGLTVGPQPVELKAVEISNDDEESK